MECYYLSKPINDEGKPIRGYRKRMHAIWRERQQLEMTEQRLCDQARMIRVNGCLTELELEQIKGRVLNENDEAVDEDVHDLEEDADVSAGISVCTNEDDRVFVVHNDDLNDEEVETLHKLNKNLRASTAIKNIMLLVASYFNHFNFIFILTNPCFDNK